MHFLSLLVWDVIGQHMLSLGWVWSTHVEIHVETLLAFEVFVQDMLRYILFPRRYRRGLVYKSEDAFCVLAGMVRIWLSYLEIFLSSLAYKWFLQHVLRYILCLHWHGICLVNTS